MTTFRLLSPSKTPNSPITVNGRSYGQQAGQAIDVDAADADYLVQNGWTPVGQSGVTANRPTSSSPGVLSLANPNSRTYFDTTLNSIVIHDGAVWRNPVTGAAV